MNIVVPFFVEAFDESLQMGSGTEGHRTDCAEQWDGRISIANKTRQFAILFKVIRRLDGRGPIIGPEIYDNELRMKRVHGLIEIRTDDFHEIIRHAAFFATAEILIASRTGRAHNQCFGLQKLSGQRAVSKRDIFS